MNRLKFAMILGACLSVACGTRPSEPTARVEDQVRVFARQVAHDVTAEGPMAWRKHFADSPSFFMAVNGKMAFPNSAAVTAGLPDIARNIPHIELNWGDDLRVDPLTPQLAVLAASYHEVLVNPKGDRQDATGFFTGTAEYRDGRWQFRNAHWSMAPSAPAVP